MSRKVFSPPVIMGVTLILLIMSCGGSSGEPPSSIDTESLPTQPGIAPTVISTSPPSFLPTVPPAIPERRLLALEFPPRIRAGDSDIVRLTLEVDKSGNITPTAVVGGNVVTGKVIEIPNLYETHHVIAEAQFDIAGVEVAPPELSSQTLLQGQSIQFFWSVRPTAVGFYRGTIWLHLRFVDKVSAQESRTAVSAQTVDIEAVNLYGFPAKVVRSAGAVGSVVGAVIGFPFFEDIVKYLFGRRRKQRR